MALVRFLGSAPQVGSFAASPDPVPSGGSTTLTASNLSDGNPGATITQVAFYYLDGTGTKQVLVICDPTAMARLRRYAPMVSK